MNMAIDSKIYRISEWVYKIIKLNILIILGSLGIVTIGASVSATAYICRKWFEGKDISIFYEFKKSYIENLKFTVIPSLIWLLISLIIAQAQYINTMTKVYFVFQIYTNMLFSIFFYLNSNYNMPLLKNILFSFKALNLNIWVLIPFYGISYISKFLLYNQPVLLICFGFGMILILINILIYVVLKKYKSEEE